jgi:molybdopterin molybdotransferase
MIPFGFPVKTTFSMKKKTQRLEWLRVIKNADPKIFKVYKYKKQGSGMISSMAYSDGIIEIPENISKIRVGDIFTFYPFETLFK